MTSVQAEYQRFLGHLAAGDVPDDVRRLARLVSMHLTVLGSVGAARRARSNRLVPIAIRDLDATSPLLEATQAEHAPTAQVGRLHSLVVGPFRGFMRGEEFDLSHTITLVYGANGTGKSSLCEALELAMLGSISEARAKRIEERVYCVNARLGRYERPVLKALVEDNAAVVQSDEAQYRFCFIEKNRLDDFARIAAKTPSDQRELIATLFGVDEFAEFVRGFNASIDQELMLVGPSATELELRRGRLAEYQKVVEAHPERMAEISAMEASLVGQKFPEVPYQSFVEWLLGTRDRQGRLQWVQEQLDSIPPRIHGVTGDQLRSLLAEAEGARHTLRQHQSALAARASEVSYAKLYEAVLALDNGAGACPACGTELEKAAYSPFSRARAGLAELAELAAIQGQATEAKNQLNQALRDLLDCMRRTVVAAEVVCHEALQEMQLPALPPSAEGDWLDDWVRHSRRPWDSLLRLTEAIEAADAKARMALEERAGLIRDRDELDQYRMEVERLRLVRARAEEELKHAHDALAKFDEDNHELIRAVEMEAPMVTHHQRIKVAYDLFLPELQGYLTDLPKRLLQGLGERARQLYNAFNREDPPGDLLGGLWLPLGENEKIEVEFSGEPGRRYDALVVLSEGHIKCLGLAILLAKNIEQGCPFVIFDDVVNAIDDDHRHGILRAFFEDGYLGDKQIILTSHSEEFILRIQQELGAQQAASVKRYKFLPHLGEHELRVDGDPPTKNYVLLAQRARDADDKRDALKHSRSALESLTDRLWKWLGNRGVGRIELKLDGPRGHWELNNKCSKLRATAGRLAGQFEALGPVVNALDVLLGVSRTSIEWGYLNGGVHDSERDHDFDRATVRRIVEALTQLDGALDELQGRQHVAQ